MEVEIPKQIGDLTLYNEDELSELLDIRATKIRKYLRQVRIKARMLARRWYVSEESLKNYFRIKETDIQTDEN